MVKQAMIFASVLSALLVVGLGGYYALQQRGQLERAKREMAVLQAGAEESAARAAAIQRQLSEELTNRHTQIARLTQEKELATQNRQAIEGEMRAALQNKDVTISELQGKLTVNILDRVLFDSGAADLKPEGEKVLAQVAGVLTQHTNRQIYVVGHTDNVPIRASAFARHASNWELSTARATSAVRYLTEKAAVSPKLLAAVGYGEFHPVADNATAEGRARNRRISIVIMPEHFNPIETPEPFQAPETNAIPAPANPPPVPAEPAPSAQAPPTPATPPTNEAEAKPPE